MRIGYKPPRAPACHSAAVILFNPPVRERSDGANVLVAIFAERESHAAYFLQEQEYEPA